MPTGRREDGFLGSLLFDPLVEFSVLEPPLPATECLQLCNVAGGCQAGYGCRGAPVKRFRADTNPSSACGAKQDS
jgi:hypothetical protein